MAAEAAPMKVLVAANGSAGAVKALLAACVAGAGDVEVVAADAALPFGTTVALQVGASSTLHGANAVARYFALAANVLNANSLASDHWMEWEANALHADVTSIATAVANGDASFPLTDADLRAARLAGDEKLNAMRYRSGAKPAAAATGAAIVRAVNRLSRQLASLNATLAANTSAFLLGNELCAGDVCIFGSLQFLFANAVIAQDAYPAVAAYYDAIAARGDAKDAIKKAAAATAGVELPPVTDGTSMCAWLGLAFTAALYKAYPAAKKANLTAAVTPAAGGNRFKHHYQCNSAMKVAAILRTGNPRAVGQALAKAFPQTDVVARLEVAGPGYVNIYMSPSFLSGRVRQVAASGLAPPASKPQRVVVDYSSPNIAKEMHVGHLRSTIIGDTIARVLEYVGHDVKRINHVGDWGTQFGMLIAHMKDSGVTGADGTVTIANLTTLYKAAKARAKDDAAFMARAHEETAKLQSGDEENRRLWKALYAKSEEMFSSVYRRLGIDSRLEIVGESFYQPFIGSIVEQLTAKGMLQDSDGAKVAFVRPAGKPPLMIIKSNGAVGYDTTDMACIWYRTQKLKAQRLVYVVDAGQGDHFENVFAGAKKAGWLQDATAEHVKFGVVLGEDGSKFKTRSGETVKLVSLLDRARDLCMADLQARAAEGGGGTLVAPEDFESTAENLGYGGVKYFDLRQNRISDYKFSYDKMLDHKGDTAVYMQYAHARIASIGRKAGVDPASVDPSLLDLAHESELNLAFQVTRFQEVVQLVEEDLVPHRLCEYLWKLANHFSDFFHNCRVVGDPKQSSRLVLCHAVARVFRKCMLLLGITPIDRL